MRFDAASDPADGGRGRWPCCGECFEATGEALGIAGRLGKGAHLLVGEATDCRPLLGRRRVLTAHRAESCLRIASPLGLAGRARLGRGDRILSLSRGGLGLLATSSRVVDRAVGLELLLAAGAALVAELRLEAVDLPLRGVARVLGAALRLVQRDQLRVAGLGVVVTLLLASLTVEGRARQAETEGPARWPHREQHRGENREIGPLGRVVDLAHRARRIPGLDGRLHLGALDEPLGHPRPEHGIDAERSVELLAGRPAPQPACVEARERSENGRQIAVVARQGRRGHVEERGEERLGNREPLATVVRSRRVSRIRSRRRARRRS